MDQRSGRPAEKEFSLLCSRNRLTCNPSSEDDHGWDFVVEIPSKQIHGLSADHARPVVQVLVQVKSTRGQRANARLKVSNALHFAKSPLPCFVVLFQENRDGNVEVFARHFSGQLIADTLKRAREVSATAKELNKSTIHVRFTEQDKHNTSLIDWLVATVQNLPENYADMKRDFGARVGYEEGWLHGEMHLGPMKGIGELIDHQLGLTPTIPASSIKVVDRRFGIEVPIFQGKPTQVRIRSLASKECQVVLMAMNGDSMLLSANLTVPAIPDLQENPSQDYKLRIETWFLSVVVQRNEAVSVEFGVPVIEKLPLQRIVEIARLIYWGDQGPIDLKVIGDGMHLLSCHLKLKQVGNGLYFRDLATIADTLREIHFRAATESVNVSLNDFQASASKLVDFHNVLTASDMRVDAVLAPDYKPTSSYSQMIAYAEVEIAEYLFFVVLDASVAEYIVDENQVRIGFGAPVWRDCLVGTDSAKLRREGQLSYDRWRSKHDGPILALGNIISIFEQSKAVK